MEGLQGGRGDGGPAEVAVGGGQVGEVALAPPTAGGGGRRFSRWRRRGVGEEEEERLRRKTNKVSVELLG
jgi:hypothetical protein